MKMGEKVLNALDEMLVTQDDEQRAEAYNEIRCVIKKYEAERDQLRAEIERLRAAAKQAHDAIRFDEDAQNMTDALDALDEALWPSQEAYQNREEYR